MAETFGTAGQALTALLLLAAGLGYGWSWRRVRRAAPALAARRRLAAFLLGLACLALALIAPFYQWSELLLTGRILQKLALCLFAPPLLWLACPFHIVLRSLPLRARQGVTRRLLRSSALRQRLVRFIQPATICLLFVSVVLLWHDPAVVEWTLSSRALRLLSLWVLFGTALLYWWPVVGTGPRAIVRFTGWGVVAYLLAAEIPNMAAGVTIAFTSTPLYASYAAVHELVGRPFGLPIGALEDQMIGGALLWMTGSFVYIASIVLVIHGLFRRDGAQHPQPLHGWDAHENLIAPGLEHRLENDGRRHTWS